MHEFQERIIRLLDEGQTLVMPTEESARTILSFYVSKKKENAFVRKSQAIAFDRFRDSLFPENRGKTPSDRISRLLFSSYLVETRGDDLKYFIPNGSYPEIKEQMTVFFSNLLPSLEEALKLETDESARKDIRLIKDEYDKFLERSGLYEKAFTDSEYMNRDLSSFVAVLSSSSAEQSAFLKTLPSLKREDPEDKALPALDVYDNERQEVRNTILKIRKLISSGVDLSEIAITTACYERIRPYLESESYLFSVPLSFRRGLSPLDYPAGSFIKLLRTLHEGDYRIEDLKAFFLNPSFPFRNPEDGRRFVEDAISRSIRQRGRKDRYFAAEKNTNKVYSDLLHYNYIINTATSPDYMIRELKSLMEKLFKPEQFSLIEEDERVLSFIFREASSFSSTFTMMKNGGYVSENTAIFPLFLKYLESSIYVPQEKMEGVKVYPLGQSNAIPMKYHFVMGLNEKEARNTYLEASFLSDYEIRKLREEEDSTRPMLVGLLEMGETVTFSASKSTYEGYALPLTEFCESRTPVMLEDAYSLESKYIKNQELTSELYEVQKKSHDKAKISALRKPSSADDMTRDKKIVFPSFSEEGHRYSLSQVDKYIKCPYAYALDYVFGLNRSQKLEIDEYPFLEIGNRLHKVVENYFENPGDVETLVPELLNEQLDMWEHRETVDRNGNKVMLKPDVQQLTPALRSNIFARYKDGLIESVNFVKSLGGEVELEKEVSGVIANLQFHGFIDCLVHFGSSYRILDFKSSSVPKNSLQLEIYRELIDGNERFESASYVALKTAKETEKKDMVEKDELETILSDVASRMENGDFSAASTSEACEKCPYRGICRRRFYIQ